MSTARELSTIGESPNSDKGTGVPRVKRTAWALKSRCLPYLKYLKVPVIDSRGCQESTPAPKPGWPLGLRPPYCSESSCLPEGTALTEAGSSCWRRAFSLPAVGVRMRMRETRGGGRAHTQLSQEVAAGAKWRFGHAGELLYPRLLTRNLCSTLLKPALVRCAPVIFILRTWNPYKIFGDRHPKHNFLKLGKCFHALSCLVLGLQFSDSCLCLSKTSRSFSLVGQKFLLKTNSSKEFQIWETLWDTVCWPHSYTSQMHSL